MTTVNDNMNEVIRKLVDTDRGWFRFSIVIGE